MDFTSLVADSIATGKLTFTLPLPTVGDYKLAELRAACRPHGVARFAPDADGETLRGLRVTIVPEDVTANVLALAMLVRDDVVGLERAIVSAIDQVDEICIAVDGRSAPATRAVAEAYADTVVVFNAQDIELSQADWDADKIHFANARNVGRERVQAPWSLVLDADEFLASQHTNLRAFLCSLGDVVGGVSVHMGTDNFSHQDAQRLARSQFRFTSAMHNQLHIVGDIAGPPEKIFIEHDISLRTEQEMVRRRQQREDGVVQLATEGKRGDMSALFHAAKHYLGCRDDRGIELTEYYRLRTEIHGPHAAERVWLALGVAAIMQEQKDFRRAEQWAVRALLDGPRVEAFAALGDIAEEEGDLVRALRWYECACVVAPEHSAFTIHNIINEREERRAAIRLKLEVAAAAG